MDLAPAPGLLFSISMKRIWGLGLALFGLAIAAACGGSTQCVGERCSDTTSSSGASGNTSGSSSSSSSSGSTGVVTSGRVPKNHRAVATVCDGVRPTSEPTHLPTIDAGSEPNGYIKCRTNAECTAGKNGRCNGNGHDGWQCTYDACQTDTDCAGNGVCECGGGFRADNDVCLESACRVDADCGTKGFCSPTLGDCGNYTGTVGYFCHQPSDECVDDEDCGGTTGPSGKGSCRYNKMVGHWRCETSECAG